MHRRSSPCAGPSAGDAGIGSIVGAGIFVLTGVAAKDIAGPSVRRRTVRPSGPATYSLTRTRARTMRTRPVCPQVVLSYLFAGIACVFSGLCYSAFASRIPVAGTIDVHACGCVSVRFRWIR